MESSTGNGVSTTRILRPGGGWLSGRAVVMYALPISRQGLSVTLHGFHTVRGTGTASLEGKVLQHPMDRREEVLYEIFLDLHKAYGALDCSR